MELNFNIKEIREYEEKIGLKYELWSEETKIDFFQWKQYKDQIKLLDQYVINENPDYNKRLQEYLDLGFEVLYSKGDQNNPIRDDTEEIFQNEKILYHRNFGIIGNITKVDNRNGKIYLRPFDFYYEIKKLSQEKVPIYESRKTGYGQIHEVQRIMEDYNLNTPWVHANDDILLTRQLHGTSATTREIIATFDEDIINALGYEKRKDGKIYTKKERR